MNLILTNLQIKNGMTQPVNPFKVVCVDDSKRPKQIPIDKWVVKDNVYTVIAVELDVKLQANVIGFVLDELPLGENEFPYLYFNAIRFLPQDALEQKEELVEELVEFNV
jgi:hypothetical protein